MKTGFLNDYFRGVAVKRLSRVEIYAAVSNQHEFNVNKSLLQLFGKPEGKVRYITKFLYVSDFEDEQNECESVLTWYDARERTPNRSEYRLYFPSVAKNVMGAAEEGDSMFLCLRPERKVLLIIARKGSTAENQLYYLFNLAPVSGRQFESKVDFNGTDTMLEVVVRSILEKIGVKYKQEDDMTLIAGVTERFGGVFPGTELFSAYARETVKDADPVDDPDGTLIRWYDRETMLFKIMEKHIIKKRLIQGFVGEDGVDVDGFLKFSLSVQNRRKSRAGMALENNISEILRANQIRFDRTPVTEHRNRPDFLFPGAAEYHDPAFPAEYLSMLGAKTTSKDRWRQVLDEADRIPCKHLITLEGAISENQTDQMKTRDLQLVVPLPIQETYTKDQQRWLFSLRDFLDVVKDRQRFCL